MKSGSHRAGDGSGREEREGSGSLRMGFGKKENIYFLDTSEAFKRFFDQYFTLPYSVDYIVHLLG